MPQADPWTPCGQTEKATELDRSNLSTLLEAAIGIEPMNKGFAGLAANFHRVCSGCSERFSDCLSDRACFCGSFQFILVFLSSWTIQGRTVSYERELGKSRHFKRVGNFGRFTQRA